MTVGMSSYKFCLLLIFTVNYSYALKLNPIFAINCGGQELIDSNGVKYSADSNNQGITSGYGQSFIIHRAHASDVPLYQTERYHTSSFFYEFPLPPDGEYVLHLKFAEVWFNNPFGKVFSVELNGGLRIIEDLDIFQKAGFSAAHDENIPISIKEGSLFVDQMSTKLHPNEKLRITFVKGDYDNPKINAIALFKNSLEDIPKLPPLEMMEDQYNLGRDQSLPHDDSAEGDNFPKPIQKTRRSEIPPSLAKPPAPDPYGSTDYSTYVLPMLIALFALLPLIFLLYRL